MLTDKVRRAAAAVGTAAALLLALLLAACGGSDGSATASGKPLCQVGGPSHIQYALVGSWARAEGKKAAATVIGCFGGPPNGPAEIVGYPDYKASACAIVDSIRQHEPHGHVCASEGRTFRENCYGKLGCITGYVYVPEHGYTELSGPLDPSVKSVTVKVDGKPAKGDFGIAHVSGSLQRQIEAEMPFGFYAAFLPGCVGSKRVEVILRGEGGDPLGKARGWSEPYVCEGPS